MMYEIKFFYYERNEDNSYDKNNLKNITKNIGGITDEIDIKEVAGVIMKQLARRDIWVETCEVYEYSKKQISFKETKGGIVLKNKKFLFDVLGNSLIEELIIEEEIKENIIPKEKIKKKPSREPMVFEPLNPTIPTQLGLTYGKAYQIIEEISPSKDEIKMGAPTKIKLNNDKGKEILVSIEHFNEIIPNRLQFGSAEKTPDIRPKLSYSNSINVEMPSLR